MKNQQLLLKLFKDTLPLKLTLSSTTDYKKLRFDFNDIVGFMDEKIIHVFMKYQETHTYEELKALTLTSLYHQRARVYRQYGKETSLDGCPELAEEPTEDFNKQLEDLIITLKKVLSPSQAELATLILIPPAYVLTQITNRDKRIPSRLFLEYLDLPIDKIHVKRFNKFRKRLFVFIKSNVDYRTFELSYLS